VSAPAPHRPHADAVLDLPEDELATLARAARPLWEELERLGWTDGYAGGEFASSFPFVLARIHELANWLPYAEPEPHDWRLETLRGVILELDLEPTSRELIEAAHRRHELELDPLAGNADHSRAAQ